MSDMTTFWPVIAVCMGVINALIAVIYSNTQKETAATKAHVERVEANFDTFKRTEFRDLQDALNRKLDQVIEALHQLNVNLVGNYAKKDDVREAIDRLNKPQ